MEKNSCFWNIDVQKLNEWMKDKNRKKPCAWCKRLWRAFDAVPAGNSRASSWFSACHIIPLSGCIHRKAINRNKPFPGRNRILSANSSSVKPQRLSRSRWRIHRATIERFISVYIGGKDTTFRRSSCVLQFSFAGFHCWYTDSYFYKHPK